MTTIHWFGKLQEGTYGRSNRWLVAIALFAGACLAYLPYGLATTTPARVRLPLWIAIAAGFGVAAIAARASVRLQRAWPPLFALFVASAAQLIDWQLSHWLPRLLGIPVESPAGLALDKLESSLLLTICILGFVLLAGDSLRSLYLQRGKVRWWLPIGIATFLFFALTSLWAAQNLFGSTSISIDSAASVLPWVLIFVLANGFAEELLFRGLLLPRFKPLIGAGPAILVVTAIFALWHVGATYTDNLPLFLAIVAVLGLSWAVLTVKTDSLWGSVLFHAGTDIPIVLALLATL